MYGLCVESSHKRGMGNLFRTLNIVRWLSARGKEFVLMINEDDRSLAYLGRESIPFITVDLWDYESNWERQLIREYGIDVWIDDRMATDIRHARNVKNEGIKLCTFDDTGSGSEMADLNFCSMIFENVEELRGRKVYTDLKYMILNPEIEQYRRTRRKKENILVTLGGSDTYGATVKVAEGIKGLAYRFTIVTGFCFENANELNEVIRGTEINVRDTVPSLIEYMPHFDLAITGGGITSFEAIAQGLPCIIIANEPHEEQVGRFFKGKGCAEYLGLYKELDISCLRVIIEGMDIPAMSRRCLEALGVDGIDHVMGEIDRGR